jgi:hypothetical protein
MFRNAARGFRVQGVLSGALRRTHNYAFYASMRSAFYCVPVLP